VHYRWRAAISIEFILKFYLHLTMRKSDFSWFAKYLLIMSFFLTRCCTLTWVMKIMLRAISNVHAGRRFPPLPYSYPDRGKMLSIQSFKPERVRNAMGCLFLRTGPRRTSKVGLLKLFCSTTPFYKRCFYATFMDSLEMTPVKVSLRISIGIFVYCEIIHIYTIHESKYAVMKLLCNGNSKAKKN